MKEIFIFTPTQRPGIDVSIASIQRQIVEDDINITWMVVDELFNKREKQFKESINKKEIKHKVIHTHIDKLPGHKRNLAAAYNFALGTARNLKADMFISLQDYIYVPEYGVQNFIDLYESLDNKKILMTGICNISGDPEPDKIKDPNGLITIFHSEYSEKPQKIEWQDVRLVRLPDGHEIFYTGAIEWETNWAAITKEALYDKDLYYDDTFDRFVAYENQDYAYKAIEKGYEVLLQKENQAISLPHKKYFPEEWAEEEPMTQKNREYLESKGYAI